MAPSYRGRFAPSPTGPLHFGSLVAAVASFVDARSHKGQWLVRIEDIDPPRERAGAADAILRTLDTHHLHWDEPVLYQSNRLDAYHQALEQLQKYLYPCECTRQRLTSLGGRYDGHCLYRPPPTLENCALRIRCDQISNTKLTGINAFDDLIQGSQQTSLSAQGDFILVRKDGLLAYQLAVAVDDNFQQISHIIRGSDLLNSTARQRYLLSHLDAALPQYGHLPLVLNKHGEKLCKQHGAAAVDNQQAAQNITQALIFLGHTPPPEIAAQNNSEYLLTWAADNWQRRRIPKTNNPQR